MKKVEKINKTNTHYENNSKSNIIKIVGLIMVLMGLLVGSINSIIYDYIDIPIFAIVLLLITALGIQIYYLFIQKTEQTTYYVGDITGINMNKLTGITRIEISVGTIVIVKILRMKSKNKLRIGDIIKIEFSEHSNKIFKIKDPDNYEEIVKRHTDSAMKQIN